MDHRASSIVTKAIPVVMIAKPAMCVSVSGSLNSHVAEMVIATGTPRNPIDDVMAGKYRIDVVSAQNVMDVPIGPVSATNPMF